MNRLVPFPAASSIAIAGLGAIERPAIVARAGHQAGRRYVEFFTAHLRNRNTRAAYARASTVYTASGFRRGAICGDATAVALQAAWRWP